MGGGVLGYGVLGFVEFCHAFVVVLVSCAFVCVLLSRPEIVECSENLEAREVLRDIVAYSNHHPPPQKGKTLNIIKTYNNIKEAKKNILE